MKHYFIFEWCIHLKKKSGKKNCINSMENGVVYGQWWIQRHKARDQGQGHKRNPRPRTALLEVKHMNARGQGPRAQVFSKKKRSSKKFLGGFKTKVFKIIFQAIYKILTIQKIMLSSNWAIFEDLRLRGQDF